MHMLSGTVDVELVRLRRSVLTARPIWRALSELAEGEEEACTPPEPMRWREWLRLFWLLTAIG